MNQVILKETDEHVYFTMLPNIIDDADLDPFEFRILIHYYRINNKIYESNKTTCKKCGISERTLRDKRKSLAEKGWIKLEYTAGEDAGYGQVIVILVDKWGENIQNFSSDKWDDEPPAGDADPRQEMPTPPAGDADIRRTIYKNTKKEKEKVKKEKEKTIIPESLDDPSFRSAWEQFQRYRKESRKTMTERSKVMMLNKLAKYPSSIAVLALENSIANGYTGVFPESIKGDYTQRDGSKDLKIVVGDDGGFYA